MKIVFLDSSTVDYGDIDLSLFQELGDFISYPVTDAADTVKNLQGAAVAITNKVVIDEEVIKSLPDLKLIVVSATGYNNIDISSAKAGNIRVSNVSAYSTYSTAQMTITFILALATNLIKYNEASHDGRWSRSPIFTMGDWPSFELRGKTIGILGLGSIGAQVANFCDQFGMKVIALHRDDVPYTDSIERLKIEDLAAQSDVISVHMPLTNYSRKLINRGFFEKMKPSAFFINMGRGPIVDHEALIWALENGIIAGAALDVTEKEPIDADDPLLKAPNLILTPHTAWASRESRQTLVQEIYKNIEAFQNGEERNIVA